MFKILTLQDMANIFVRAENAFFRTEEDLTKCTLEKRKLLLLQKLLIIFMQTSSTE